VGLYIDPSQPMIRPQEMEALGRRQQQLELTLWRDASLATARTQRGLQITADAYSASLPSAWNSGSGYDASKLTTGSVATSLLTPNIQSAWNAGGSAYSASLLGAGTLPTARLDASAGTTAANKPLVAGANQNLDVLTLAQLRLGAGAGTAVTASATDLNKTTGIEANATQNPQQAAVADVTATIGSLTIASQGSNVAAQDSVQAAINAIQAYVDSTLRASHNTLLSRLRPSGARIIG